MATYNPPSGNAVTFDFKGSYSPPSGAKVTMNFTINDDGGGTEPTFSRRRQVLIGTF